ncbi:MAG: hypothetical protein WC322_00180 [Candidatus Paceibacterota bacterium]|jgi:hypothetical protein
MLIFDDSEGQSDIKEKDTLDAMLAVGSEFMTDSDDESTVQRSGEFVKIEKEPGSEPFPRHLLLHETCDVFTKAGVYLGDNDYFNLSDESQLDRRTLWYVAGFDGESQQGTAFREKRGPDMVRMPRCAGQSDPSGAKVLFGLYERSHTAIHGKRRMFVQDDGKVLVLRDVVQRGGRFYYGAQTDSFTSVRSARVSQVELVPYDPQTGKTAAPIFAFPVFSGVSVDVTEGLPKLRSNVSVDPALPMYDATRIYNITTGALGGMDFDFQVSNSTPYGGDPGAVHDVCPPAMAKTADGKLYQSIIAVYAGDDDVRAPASAGAYRLTCKYTTLDAGAKTTKIVIPDPSWIGTYPGYYYAVSQVELVRTAPTKAFLYVRAHVMQGGAKSTYVSATDQAVLYYCTADAGATWTLLPTLVGMVPTLGGMLARDEDTLLTFETMPDYPTAALNVRAITPSSISVIGSIPLSAFYDDLFDPGFVRVPYLAFGFGGVTYIRKNDQTIKRLWMQFDPRWYYEDGSAFNLTYPASRPLLMVSDDGGKTWARRFLPTPWAFLAGFVVSTGPGELAVPVQSPRVEGAKNLTVTIYRSRNGGDTWTADANAQARLTARTRIDGGVVIGRRIGSGHQERYEQDLSDCWLEYNRGELAPMLTLRDEQGRFLNSDPARPWVVDARKDKPIYG